MKKKQSFTLIELMVVVAIIAFLAALAVPQYFTYLTKAKRAEVAVNLSSLATALQVYYAENGTFPKSLAGKDGVDWQPAGYQKGGKNHNFYYTYGFNFSGAQEGTHYFTGKLNTPKNNLKNTFLKTDKFAAAAAGKISGNIVDIWTIDENRNLVHVQDALRKKENQDTLVLTD